jgi:hypothetical protein
MDAQPLESSRLGGWPPDVTAERDNPEGTTLRRREEMAIQIGPGGEVRLKFADNERGRPIVRRLARVFGGPT